MLPKLSAACLITRKLFPVLNSVSLQIAYVAYFQSVIKYGIFWGGNSANACEVFKLQKKIIRIMSGVEARRSYGGLFEKLDILPVPCQFIVSINVLYSRHNNFYTSLNLHRLNTRNKNRLYVPTAHLSALQTGITYSGIRIFNRLPSNIQDLRNGRVRYKNKLCNYLIINSFYSVTKFLEPSTH
jgi:hypothetical protein